MEAVMLQYSSPDQSISPYKQIRNRKRNTRPFISRPSEHFATIHGGLLHAPPPSLSFSFPPSVSVFNIPQQQQHHYHQQQQPPLLPLPISKPYINALPSRSRGLSCSPTNKKINRTRDQSLTPKKSSKPNTTIISPKKENSKQVLRSSSSTTMSECLVIASTNRLGPDPKDLPKDVSRVLSSGNNNNNNVSSSAIEDLEKFSGSVFTLVSPPPSSLPLPKFSIRPKLSCNAEAGGIDTGATDNLRRLLRLR